MQKFNWTIILTIFINNLIFAQYEVKWIFNTDIPIYSSPIVSNNKIFITTHPINYVSEIFAINAETGRNNWTEDVSVRLELAVTFVCSPAVYNGVLYSGTVSGNFFAYDINTLERKWILETSNMKFTTPTIIDDIIYFGCEDGHLSRNCGYLYALYAKTGEIKWEYKVEGSLNIVPNVPKPVIIDSLIYFRGFGKCLYVIDSKTGTKKWEFVAQNSITTNPTYQNEIIYFADWGGNLYSINIHTGKESWRFKADNSIFTDLSIIDNLGFFGCQDGYLYAIDIRTGKEMWKFKTGGPIYSTPAIFDGVVYFGSDDHNLYAIDIKIRKEKWKFKAGGWIRSSPAIADETIYFGCQDGKVYAIDLK